MTEVRWTLQAVEDLAAIKVYIAIDSAAYANIVVSRLFNTVGQLRDYPDSGRIVPERANPRLRELVRPPYRIAYLRLAERVDILTVFHSAQQLPEVVPA